MKKEEEDHNFSHQVRAFTNLRLALALTKRVFGTVMECLDEGRLSQNLWPRC